MGFRGFIVLVVLMGMRGGPTEAISLKDVSVHPIFVAASQVRFSAFWIFLLCLVSET